MFLVIFFHKTIVLQLRSQQDEEKRFLLDLRTQLKNAMQNEKSGVSKFCNTYYFAILMMKFNKLMH